MSYINKLEKYLVLFFCFLALSSYAQSSKISRISIEGNRRVEKDAILNQIQTKVGQVYTLKDVRSSIESIYATKK
ncbi:MAG: hypothetical protein HYY62_03685 [Deltaproteobacteria bacterium]|nr:hypothetical protein [Deltaproteobacteria bacterium]